MSWPSEFMDQICLMSNICFGRDDLEEKRLHSLIPWQGIIEDIECSAVIRKYQTTQNRTVQDYLTVGLRVIKCLCRREFVYRLKRYMVHYVNDLIKRLV